MGEMGVSPRPTVAQWLRGKQEQRKRAMQDALINWDRSLLGRTPFLNIWECKYDNKFRTQQRKTFNLLPKICDWEECFLYCLHTNSFSWRTTSCSVCSVSSKRTTYNEELPPLFKQALACTLKKIRTPLSISLVFGLEGFYQIKISSPSPLQEQAAEGDGYSGPADADLPESHETRCLGCQQRHLWQNQSLETRR